MQSIKHSIGQNKSLFMTKPPKRAAIGRNGHDKNDDQLLASAKNWSMTGLWNDDEAWAFMRPWWEILERMHLQQDKVTDARVEDVVTEVAFFLNSNTSGGVTTKAQYTGTREAMELVALLAHVDEEAMLRSPPYYSSERLGGRSRPVRFVVELIAPPEIKASIDEERELMDDIISHIFAPICLDQYSCAYQETREQLLACIKSPERRHECENIKISVVFGCEFYESSLYTSFYYSMARVFASQSRQVIDEQNHCPFRLEGVSISVVEDRSSKLEAADFG